MKTVLRHARAPGERLGRSPWPYAAGGLVLAALAVCLLPPALVPRCLFRGLTGWPCITCGSYRCARFLLHGQFGAAFAIQPLACVGMLAAALFALCTPLAAAAHWPQVRAQGLTPRMRRAAIAILATLILVNWIYLIARGV